MDQLDFRDKKILVTGGSSGLGRQTAILLSEMGADVVIMARREEELKKTLSLMRKGSHFYLAIDISDFDQMVQAIKSIVERDGKKLDGAAHCAAIAVPIPLRAIRKSAMDELFATNFYSFAAILKCAGGKKYFNDGSSIVGVSSWAAPYGQRGNGIYAATKGAMDTLMKCAAKELRPKGIRVNTICPGGMRTEMLVNQTVKFYEGDSLETLPEGLMEPKKVASIIATLLSDSMQYVSGIAMDVDQGKF